MIPLAQLASTCMQQIEDHNQTDPSKALKTITDSLVLLANVTHKLNMKRRDNVKPELKDAYKTLCSPQNEISTFLLGEDLPKLAKDSKESSNMTTHMVREQTKGRGFHPYPYRARFTPNRGRGRGRGYHSHFLGKTGDSQMWNRPHSQRGRGNHSRPYKK